MTTSIRRLPLLVLMLAGSACSSADDPLIIPDDAGAADGAETDDGTRTTDATSPEASDGTGGTDAPPGTDAGNRADAGSGIDAGNRSDTGMRIDAAIDGARDGDAAPPRIDVTADTIDAPPVHDSAPPPPDGGTGSCVGTVDTEFLREKLSKLSGALPVLIGGVEVTIGERYTAANRARARQFLTAEYEALGFTVTEHTYGNGANLVATKPGADAKFLILSGHYDSVRETVPGADDDGTGIIGSLATAKALQSCQLDHGLRILAFDQEESGAQGSKAYVSQLQSSGEINDLIGDVQYEMAGYHTKPDYGFLLVDCRSSEGDRPESKFLNDAVLAAITRGNLPLQPYDACVGSSDHGTFWTAGKPAIVFSEEFSFSGANANPCYHRECDTVAFVNFDYYTKMTTLAVLVTADLVGAH
jgi:hypothetical protein